MNYLLDTRQFLSSLGGWTAGSFKVPESHSTLSLSQSLGAGLLVHPVKGGLCLVDLTTYLYFIALTPLVYRTFLYDFFG